MRAIMEEIGFTGDSPETLAASHADLATLRKEAVTKLQPILERKAKDKTFATPYPQMIETLKAIAENDTGLTNTWKAVEWAINAHYDAVDLPPAHRAGHLSTLNKQLRDAYLPDATRNNGYER